MKHWYTPAAEITPGELVTRTLVLVAGWLGSITLSDLHQLVGLLTGLAILFYTISNTWVLWRDKILRKKKPPKSGAEEARESKT